MSSLSLEYRATVKKSMSVRVWFTYQFQMVHGKKEMVAA